MTDSSPAVAPEDASENAFQDAGAAAPDVVQEPRLWHKDGWMARVIKNEDDDGWAVEMIKDGEPEPALVGPWTMGRDKKNPKPLDTSAFNTLVKTASEVLRRHEQQLRALLHKRVGLSTGEGDIDVTLDIVPDEYEPYALLTALDAFGEQIAQVRVAPTFKLTQARAQTWAEGGFGRID
ncbi:hypothetical protein [Paraburkholderia sp. J63]|uniref:hypothetical protein n=1 Tax=Paraburkholderia sp. J63 TaxID=2805434 RepID=UPI002ABE20EE|nr:hypothetical protein [Paraburkholderia sp. J63]